MRTKHGLVPITSIACIKHHGFVISHHVQPMLERSAFQNFEYEVGDPRNSNQAVGAALDIYEDDDDEDDDDYEEDDDNDSDGDDEKIVFGQSQHIARTIRLLPTQIRQPLQQHLQQPLQQALEQPQ